MHSRDTVCPVRVQVRSGVLLVRHANIVMAYGSCDVEKYLPFGARIFSPLITANLWNPFANVKAINP